MDVGTPEELANLLGSLGKPDADVARMLDEDAAASPWHARATGISSTRIVTDCTRLFGKAWEALQRFSDEERDAVHGVTQDILAYGVARTKELSDAISVHRSARQHAKTGSETREAERAEAHALAIKTRDQLAFMVGCVLGPDSPSQTEVHGHTGSADDDRDLALGLRHLSAAARKLLADRSPAIKRRVKGYALHASLAERGEKLADRLDQLGLTNATDRGREMDQGALDKLDAQCLYVLSLCIHAFDLGHAQRQSVPRLIPDALLRQFGRVHRTPTEATPPPPPAPVPAPAKS